MGTNLAYESESKSDGGFVFLNLPVGTYKVVATTAGFRTFTATGITLVLDQVYALNIRMELGQVSEQVVVEAANVQVETANTQLGAVINGDTIRDMPLIGRNWVNLQQTRARCRRIVRPIRHVLDEWFAIAAEQFSDYGSGLE